MSNISSGAPPIPIITVHRLGGLWCGVMVNPDKSKYPITNLSQDKKLVKTIAKTYAAIQGLPYRKNVLIAHKPIVTVWKALGNWVPAKIFEDRIEGAGITTTKEAAKHCAQQLAIKEQLDYFPSIGESAFPDE